LGMYLTQSFLVFFMIPVCQVYSLVLFAFHSTSIPP
jgi:hypothetical protein